MTLRSKHLAPIIAAAFIAGIGGTMAFNLWQTTSSKAPATYKSGEFAGKADPADIRGSYTFGDISKSFAVTAEELARAFGAEKIADPAAFMVKQLEEMFAGQQGGEIGTDSVRWFVALYTGLPYTPEEDTLLPAAALEALAGKLNAEELAKLKARAAGVPASAAAAPAPAVPAASAAAEGGAAPTEEPAAGEIRGKTTFGELLSWGVKKEAIEAALGMPMGGTGVSVRDYCAQKGIEFSTVKEALQEAVDKARAAR